MSDLSRPAVASAVRTYHEGLGAKLTHTDAMRLAIKAAIEYVPPTEEAAEDALVKARRVWDWSRYG